MNVNKPYYCYHDSLIASEFVSCSGIQLPQVGARGRAGQTLPSSPSCLVKGKQKGREGWDVCTDVWPAVGEGDMERGCGPAEFLPHQHPPLGPHPGQMTELPVPMFQEVLSPV